MDAMRVGRQLHVGNRVETQIDIQGGELMDERKGFDAIVGEIKCG